MASPFEYRQERFSYLPEVLAVALMSGVAFMAALDLVRGSSALFLVGATSAAVALAWFAARARRQARHGLDRLRILDQVTEVAGQSRSVEETLAVVESAVVPALADICIIDRVHRDSSGESVVERYSVAVSGPESARIRRALESRETSVPADLLEGRAGARGGPGGAVRLQQTVDEDKLRSMSHDAEDLEFMRSLGLASFIHVALRSRGEHLGVLTLAVAWSGRRYTETDARFAENLAGHVAQALDNAGLTSDLRSVQRRLDTAMAVLDEAVVIHDADGRLGFANPAAARLFGAGDPGELVGLTMPQVQEICRIYDEDGVPLTDDRLAAMRDALGPESDPPIVRVSFNADGRELWLRARMKTVLGDDGQVLFTVTALEDLTAIKQEERNQALLARAGDLLASAEDQDAILARLADIAVPRLADACAVDALEADGSWRRAGFNHRDPGRLDRDLLQDGEALKLDLLAGDERVGQVTLANEAGRSGFGEADRELAERVVRRAGAALEQARLAAERAEIAAGLQQGLIPPPLPEIPGWDVSALYRPAGEHVDVGGDFYEAFRIKGGWMVMIGDVTGRGPRAASVTAQARYTLRTAGILSRDPRSALMALNRALVARGGSALCTVVLVVIREGTGNADVVNAGHPAPLMIRSSGEVAEIAERGPVLGAFDEAEWPVTTFPIEGGDRLLLHTDGVTELEHEGERFGDRRLREICAGLEPSADMLARIESSLEAFCEGRIHDDIAVLTVGAEAAHEPAEGPDVELVKQAYELFQGRSSEAMLRLFAEQAEIDVSGSALSGESQVYRGKGEIRSAVSDLDSAWEDYIVTPRTFSRRDGKVVVKGRVYARGRPLGIRDVAMTWIWEVDAGRITGCRADPGAEIPTVSPAPVEGRLSSSGGNRGI